MKTLFHEPKTIEQARRQANIMERAHNLIADGYRLVQRSRPTLWGIYKPGNTRLCSDYSVDVKLGFELCTCKGFWKDGDCKHRIAVQMAMDGIEEEEAMCREFEEMRQKAGVIEALLPDSYPF